MKAKNWVLASIAALLMTGFALQPVVSLEGARTGLDLFLTVVLPSLLPFMVCATLFIESGAAAATGRALNGLMRPLFACPGEAAFALTAGLLSGYPMGARVSLDLYEKGLITAEDARRTGILASSCGPVFMLGAVGAGMLGRPEAGWLIALSQYAGVLVTGLLFSIGGNRTTKSSLQPPANPVSPAEALGLAIKKTVETLWAVGGYIVLFSVVSALLRHYSVFPAIESAAAPALRALGLERSLVQPLAMGLIEMTNGCSAAAQAQAALAHRCAALALLVSFGGFCIQAQSMLFLSGVKLSAAKFALSKAVQATVAFLTCLGLARLPVFSSALCMAATKAAFPAAGTILGSSAAWAAGSMAVFGALAFVSGRASTRDSA